VSGIGNVIGWLTLAFGVSAPLWVIAIPNERWWVSWFLIGCFGFGWIFFVDLPRDAGHSPGTPFGVVIVVAAGLLFLISIATRGFILVMRRDSNEDSGSRTSKR
jgi:hypothetical protein